MTEAEECRRKCFMCGHIFKAKYGKPVRCVDCFEEGMPKQLAWPIPFIEFCYD